MIFVVFGLIALTLFSFSLLAQAMAARRIERAALWGSAPGTIVSADVPQGFNGGYTPQISYTYVVNGQGYASDRLRPGGTPFFYTEGKARAVTAQYPPGSPVAVRYDPQRPDRAAIELVALNYWILPLRVMAAAALVMGIVFAVATG